jgi:hypothetical protein
MEWRQVPAFGFGRIAGRCGAVAADRYSGERTFRAPSDPGILQLETARGTRLAGLRKTLGT